jgi:hypothetical protein
VFLRCVVVLGVPSASYVVVVSTVLLSFESIPNMIWGCSESTIAVVDCLPRVVRGWESDDRMTTVQWGLVLPRVGRMNARRRIESGMEDPSGVLVVELRRTRACSRITRSTFFRTGAVVEMGCKEYIGRPVSMLGLVGLLDSDDSGGERRGRFGAKSDSE